ncbi:MFS transporter [Nostocoides sp. Soil756]|uniref:MFS transporter n=1 Tax=Nostocoides sp. Soil756 TaxID=1736399 RepID=UPI0006FD78CE|nr:MFS transporter [Tetrasphaera sp. Soil756]KRE62374.1 hypothetical protein ASG78_04855 [Tetrasphaera sp. Soil756]
MINELSIVSSLAPSTAGSPPDPRRWRALAVLALVQFMLVLDNTVVNVALPSIARDLGLTPTGLAWVVNAYAITFGSLLLLSGRVADGVGRRRTYLTGLVLFAVASAACGAASDGAVLVAGRFAQGLGAAAVAPTALSMVTLLFADPAERTRAFGIWGGLAALGGTTGVVLSGALADLASWRWIFFVNVPVAAFCVLALPRLVAESRSPVRRRPDWLGAVLVTTGLVALTYAVLEAGSSGWAGARILVPLAVGVVAVAGFVLVQARATDPLVPSTFLRHRTRGTAFVAGLVVMAAFFSTFFTLTLYMQDTLGFTPLQAGLAYLPYGTALVAGIASSGAVGRRYGPGRALVPGLLIAAAGLVLLAQIPTGGACRPPSPPRPGSGSRTRWAPPCSCSAPPPSWSAGVAGRRTRRPPRRPRPTRPPPPSEETADAAAHARHPPLRAGRRAAGQDLRRRPVVRGRVRGPVTAPCSWPGPPGSTTPPVTPPASGDG